MGRVRSLTLELLEFSASSFLKTLVPPDLQLRKNEAKPGSVAVPDVPGPVAHNHADQNTILQVVPVSTNVRRRKDKRLSHAQVGTVDRIPGAIDVVLLCRGAFLDSSPSSRSILLDHIENGQSDWYVGTAPIRDRQIEERPSVISAARSVASMPLHIKPGGLSAESSKLDDPKDGAEGGAPKRDPRGRIFQKSEEAVHSSIFADAQRVRSARLKEKRP